MATDARKSSQSHDAAQRGRVYMIERTVTERFFYDPVEIAREFDWPTNGLPGEKFEDFVIRVFERFDGSIYGDEFFPSDANPDGGIDVIERWDDE